MSADNEIEAPNGENLLKKKVVSLKSVKLYFDNFHFEINYQNKNFKDKSFTSIHCKT
jgi:hypothetical protein